MKRVYSWHFVCSCACDKFFRREEGPVRERNLSVSRDRQPGRQHIGETSAAFVKVQPAAAAFIPEHLHPPATKSSRRRHRVTGL